MKRPLKTLAPAMAGLLLVLVSGHRSFAQSRTSAPPIQQVKQIAAVALGSILGVVQDERGLPVQGVVISALGATTTFAVTDKNGRFEFGTLAPGPYILRAHLTGYAAPRPQMVQVRSSARATPAIALRRADAPAILEAGVGLPDAPSPPEGSHPEVSPIDGANDHSEKAWRIRHARRAILKDARIPDDLLADSPDNNPGRTPTLLPVDVLGRAVGSPARLATSFFGETPFTGQVNLLTTGSFDTPQQLFSGENFSHGIAYVRVGAPAGDNADWNVRGVLTEADVSSWMVAGSYKTRYAGRHGYEVGLSYATQRYDGGNPLALRDVTDGNRNVGTVYGHDDFAIFPLLTVSYGGEYARYDYLGERSLLSPEVGATFRPVDGLRVTASLSQRSVAPGAEEFHPPGDSGIWLPPQRTFSSLDRTLPFEAERSTQAAIGLERDFGVSTVALRAFRQRVDDQLVTLFGADLQPASKVGHYLVGNLGDASATGYSAEFRLVLTDRVRGAVEYSVANAELTPRKNLRAVLLLTPAALRSGPERIHDVSTSVEATLHETSTRILALYRVSNGFIPSVGGSDPPGRALDARFDVQLRQSLPFMNFSNARWEMLVAVRNFFHETAPTQSIFDELLVARPPKRVIGGVTLHF